MEYNQKPSAQAPLTSSIEEYDETQELIAKLLLEDVDHISA